eukprot:scaffold8291_cov64-Phaeocystis_antarctica.AAC.1
MLGSCPIVSPHEGPLDGIEACWQPVNQRLLASGRANASGTHRGRILQHVERAVGNTLKSAGHRGAQAVSQDVRLGKHPIAPRYACTHSAARGWSRSSIDAFSTISVWSQAQAGRNIPGAGVPPTDSNTATNGMAVA